MADLRDDEKVVLAIKVLQQIDSFLKSEKPSVVEVDQAKVEAQKAIETLLGNNTLSSLTKSAGGGS